MMEFYADGGFFMDPIVVMGVWAIVIAVVSTVVKIQVDLLPGAFGLAALTLVFGFLGAAIGFVQTFEAIATAPAEMKLQMLAMSSSVALNPLILSLVLLIPIAVAIAAAVLVRNYRAK